MPSAFFHSRRLQTRIVAVYLGLLLAVQGTTYWVIHHAIDRNARQSVAESLLSGEALLQRMLQQQQDALQQATRALAEDASLQHAIDHAQTEDAIAALHSHREAVRANVTLLTTPTFVPQGQTEDTPGTALALAALLPVLTSPQAAPAHAPAMRVAHIGTQIYQVTAMPIVSAHGAPTPRAWVLMATRIDSHLLQELHSLSGLDVALLTPPPSGKRWQVLDATLPAASWPQMAQAWEIGPQRGSLSQPTFHVADDEFSARAFTLSDLQGQDALRAVLMRSVDQAIAPYRQLKMTLLGLSALGVLAFGLVGMFSARRITAPLRELSSSARQLGRGEYESEIASDFDGEIGELAQSFETMRQTIQAREGELRRLTWQDPLTELPNLEQFRRDLRQAVSHAQQRDVPCAVLLLDMDRFKQVNDLLGHRFGDRLLRAVAQRLHDGLHDAPHPNKGHTPVLARLSGDEFGILLPGADTDAAWPVAQRILADFERPLTLDGHTVDLGAGIGIASSPAHGLDADTVLSRAELAMNVAKQQHAGAIRYHEGLLGATPSSSLTLLGELRTAVDDSQLRLFLQPKVTLATGQVVGAEALVRWQHPERGVLSPVGFVPFAEQTGFVRLLTRWMIDEVARTAQTLSQQGLAMKLALNLSTRDLLDPELPQRLEDAIARHQLAPDSLVLEITESAIMDDPERAMHTLHRLRAMGLRLSIDDFGTGYSSLSYLKSLPVQELKVDRSFVMSMAADEHDAKIVQSTVELAHSLGLSVVAEGVENLATWELLQVLGCDEAQGHLIAKPMPARQFAAWVQGWQAPQSAHADVLANEAQPVGPATTPATTSAASRAANSA